jgi:DNA-binding beta-propeller fold protein YncE
MTALAAAMFLDGSTALAADPGRDVLRLEVGIPLAAVKGRIDHFAIDVDRERLYIAELGNDSLGVIDVKSGTARTVTGFSEPQGVLYVASRDQVYVPNGGDGSVSVLSGDDLSKVQRIELGADADNVRLDPSTGRAVVGYGAGALAWIDPSTGNRTSDIAVAGHPESFQFDPTGSRVFVNVPDSREIAVVDPKAGKVVGSWRQNDRANFAMTYDRGTDRLIVAFRSPAVLGVFDPKTGALKQRLPTCEDVDDLFADAKRRRLYVICGEGQVDVFATGNDQYERLARVATRRGARTGLFVPELDELFVAVPADGQRTAAVWVYRPGP